ncbi:MAG: phosphate signaling complex protein PhoU [Proteobacteria bacterium]|nr:phosphate signaling complex protein PhoU [Desulfobulbaceae bacterium]MBU4153577.1 phosphate signaling complex protein PhoU [Pseudomonadota bacterium]MDP2105380.1 phosphate signaling complex protein PhoU [Desulfobulbaceae bacterium]
MPRHLQREIESLKNKIVTMGGEVEDRVYKATLSLIRRDMAMAEAVIAADHDIDNMEVEIEEDCLKVLALHQPVAIDLRFIIAVLKINSDLERVGDLAVNIAERSVFLNGQEPMELPFDAVEMSTKVERMLTKSIDALVNLDVRLAFKVRSQDEEVDTINRNMYGRVKEMFIHAQPERVNALLHAVSVGRHLERIADHACNIAEDVIYLVNAEIVRHTPEVFEE